MIDHLLARIFTVADVGRWHGRTNYPSETDGVRMPLWCQTPKLSQEAAPAAAVTAVPAEALAATPSRGSQAGGT